MKVILEMELTTGNLEDLREVRVDEVITNEILKEELEQMLFEVCEEWVIRGDRPALEFKED